MCMRLGSFLALAIGAPLASLCLALPSWAQVPDASLQSAAAAGRMLYADAPGLRGSINACVQCHANPVAQRRGVTLNDQVDHIRCAIQGGCGGAQMAVYPYGAMAQFQGLLTGQDIQALATYIRFPQVEAAYPRPETWAPRWPSTALGSVSTVALRLDNRGERAMTLQSVAVGGTAADEYRLDAGSCLPGAVLPPRGSCSVSLSFVPRCAAVRSATLDVAHDGPLSGLRIPLAAAGHGQALAELAVSPTRLTLAGAGGAAETVSVTIANVCAGDLRVQQLIVEGPFEWAGSTDACTGQSLAAGASCSLLLRRSASAATGLPVRGSLRIVHLSGSGETVVPIEAAALVATEVAPARPDPAPTSTAGPATPETSDPSRGGGALPGVWTLWLLLAARALRR